MKKLTGLFILLIFLGLETMAQKPKSTVRFRLSDGTPLLINLNGRDFQKTGRSITVSDLPGKRQSVIVYRYRPYVDGKGGKAERVYGGTIKLERGRTYEAVIDVNNRKLRLKQVVSVAPDELPFDPKRDQAIGGVPVEEMASATNPEVSIRPELQQLKAAMDGQGEDAKKLYEAKKYLADHAYASADIKTIASWFFFDDTRLVFAKSAYAKVSDPQGYAQVAEAFTMEDNKNAFEQFLKGKQ